jgi:hypothetical protein
MTAKLGFTAALLALVAAGCALTPPIRMAACNDPECHVVVTVTDCQVSVNHDPITVNGRDHEIHWDIASTGYTFADDGIIIKDFDPLREFTDPRRPNATKFIWHDRNSVARPEPFKYGINVLRNGNPCGPHDPGIVNNG